MKKFLKTLLLVFFLCILYVYTLVIEQIPKQITIFEGEKISMKKLIGLSLKENTVETASTNENKIEKGKILYKSCRSNLTNLSFFGKVFNINFLMG